VSNPVLILLIWLVGASGCLLLYWGSKLTFLLDDWEFLLYRRGEDVGTVLEPHGEHISVAPVLIYKALLATFGMASALPFRVASTALFLLSAVLLFVLLQRRIGQWPALAATAVVLFLGAAYEDLLWAFQVGYFGSMAAGLGMLVAFDRDGRRADLLACVLLTVSILFSSLGLAFLAGAAVQVLCRADRRRRLYVVAVPLAVYALWWLGWGHSADNALTFKHVAQTPLYVLDGIASSLASLLGLAGPEASLVGGLEWGRPLAVAAIAFAAWRIYRLGRVPARLWIVLAIGATFWILAGFNQLPGRAPTASRYQYVGVVFLLLVAAELLRGIRVDRRTALVGTGVVLAVAAASLVGNVDTLHRAYADNYRPASQLEKAALGAVEIARDTVEPGFRLSEELVGTGYVAVEAGPYLDAADAYGSPGYDPAEIAAAPAVARFTADKVLFGALRMGLVPVAATALPAAKPEAAAPAADGTVSIDAGACAAVPSDGSSTPVLRLPPDSIVLRAGADPVGVVRLSRFAAPGEFPIELGEGVAAGQAAMIAVPADRSRVPWKAQLEVAGTTTVCGLQGGGE
jgi:hypothetical protein